MEENRNEQKQMTDLGLYPDNRLRKLDVHIKSSSETICDNWKELKEAILKKGMDSQTYNNLSDLITELSSKRKQNESYRKAVTSLWDAKKSEWIKIGEKSIDSVIKEIGSLQSNYLKDLEEKKKREKAALEAEEMERQKENRCVNLLKQHLIDTLKNVSGSMLRGIESRYQDLEDEKKPSFLEKAKNVKNHYKRLKREYKEAIDSFQGTHKESAISATENSLESFVSTYNNLYSDMFMELAVNLENGYATESIKEESKEVIGKAKEAIEEKIFRDEVNSSLNVQIASQGAEKASGVRKKITLEENQTISKQIGLKVVSLWVANCYDEKMIIKMAKDLLKEGCQVKELRYKEENIISKNSKIIS